MEEAQWLKIEQLAESLSASMLKASRAITVQQGSICYLPGEFRLELSVYLRYQNGLELRFPDPRWGAGTHSGEGLTGAAGDEAISRLTLTFHPNVVPAEASE